MPKPAAVARASRQRSRPPLVQMPDGIEGQITELCRDLAVEVKRMRQLQMQAEELRLVIHQWSAAASRTPGRDSIEP